MRLFFFFGAMLSILFFSCDKSTEINTNLLPADHMFDQRSYPTGTLKTDAYREALQWKRSLPNGRTSGLNWEFAGPLNIGGRISDIEIPSNSSQTYYVGAASGGIFKTTDGGANWTPIFDDQEMLSIGDIAISENNNDLIWVGTGEVNAGGGSLAYDGDGMYFSDDAGASWEPKGLEAVGSIGKVLIDPNDEDRIYVGAMGPLFRNDSNRGVYRTTDGGATWEQKLFISDSTGIIDMAIHPSNGDILYAASWERIRRPAYRQYGGETSRIYRSTDGGENWTELTNGLPSAPTDKGRISIDISRSNPNVLYASYTNQTGFLQGIYRTSNGGDTWTAVSSSAVAEGISYHWWFGGLFVDPSDENTLFYSGFNTFRSTNGGSSWSSVFNNAHVDQHPIAFNLQVPGEVLLGNDGGLYYSSNDGATYTKDETLPITQFYRVHVDAQNDQKVYGGAQDNSTMRTTNGGLSNWQIIYGGDGFQPLVDPTNTNTIFALYQRGNLGKSTNNGASFFPATSGISGSDRKNWDTPVVMDPADPQVMYYGANRLYKSTNQAGSWTAISPDLSNGPYAGTLGLGTITSISVSELDSDRIYVGTDDGNVWVTLNGGTDWELISNDLPNRWVTKVLASKEILNEVYVTFSGYRYGEDNGHVYRSIDVGLNWLDISTSLPDIPINDIVQDNNDHLYIGTDIGVLASSTEGAVWETLGVGLPSVVVNDLHFHEGSEYLYAGTYGRSMYKIDISEVILGNQAIALSSEVALYPNPASEIVDLKIPNSLLGATVELFDLTGKLIRSETASEGIHQFKISDVPSGIYLVKLSTNSVSVTKKLIVQ